MLITGKDYCMKSKRSKACDIPKKVKDIVWERDNGRCIFCGSPMAMPNAHVIPRSKGGLGVEQNIVTACIHCHDKMDHSKERKEMVEYAKDYLRSKYENWNEKELVYRK